VRNGVVTTNPYPPTPTAKLFWNSLDFAWTCDPKKVPQCPGVYFLFHVEAELVKIGVSGNVCDRFRQLRHKYKQRIQYLGCISGADRHIEKRLHRLFAAQRVCREWFTVSSRLYAAVADCCAGNTLEFAR
jgi:hypothetical protein